MLLVIIAGTAILCGAVFLALYNANAAAARENEYILSELDQRFSRRPTTLATDVSAETLMPLRIGIFQRMNITDCAMAEPEIKQCKGTAYKTGESGFVYVTVKERVNNFPDALQDFVSKHADCGAENSGKHVLRIANSNEYIYTICYLSLLTSTGSISSVTWRNGNWLFSIGGRFWDKSDAALQFVNDYPN